MPAGGDRIAKADHPVLIRAVYARYGRGPWVYADLLAVAEEIGLSLYPSLLQTLRMSGWIHAVHADGSIRRRQGHGNGYGPKLWAISAAGLRKSGAEVAGVKT